MAEALRPEAGIYHDGGQIPRAGVYRAKNRRGVSDSAARRVGQPDEIDFAALPEQFVLKCNHNSGLGMCICKDKSTLDLRKVRRELRKGLRQDYYLPGREWPYKDVPRKIIAEQYMQDNIDLGVREDATLKDYKFFCFDGTPQFLYVSDHSDQHEKAHLAFFDMNYRESPFGRTDYLLFKALPPKPAHFEQMKEIASVLSSGIPFVRVDLYEINQKVYFGELTFHPCSGFLPFKPKEWDKRLGELLTLSIK